MAKLQRKSAKVFAENASAGIGGIAQFGSLAAGNPNFSKDVDVIQALQAYKNGWTSAVTGNKSPALEDRNALDYLLSYQQAYLMQRGVPEWLDTETYYVGSFVSLDNGRMYVSKTNNNKGNNPSTDTNETNWIAFPTPADMAALVARVVALENATHPPVGSLAFGPVSTMPGFLLCDGQAVSRATYSALFSAIGTNFGNGDGSTTFNVPDYRGCFLRGLGGDSAANMHTKQPMGAPDIEGTARIGGVGSWPIYIDPVSGALYATQSTNFMSRGENQGPGPTGLGLQASRSNSVYGSANEIRPVNFAVNYFIKY